MTFTTNVQDRGTGRPRRRSVRNSAFGAVALFLILGSLPAHAVPRFSLLSGSRCSNCHLNPQGSGIRNEFGWEAMNESGALQFSDIGLGSITPSSNTFLDEKLIVGLDGRGQYAKLGRPPTAEYEFFGMQFAAHAAVVPVEEVSIYGSYNFSYDEDDKSFPGQTPWTAAIQYQPDIRLPSIRAGYIQPSVGIRYDDHTLFIRKDAARTNLPVIPPDYNEYGAELTYEGLRYLTVNAGVFDSENLMKSVRTIDSSNLSYSARIALWPQLFDPQHINSMIGGSVLVNGDFNVINLFAGFGLADIGVAVYGEGMFSDDGTGTTTLNNYTLQAEYQPIEWLALKGRYEIGNTDVGTEFSSSGYVFGAEFFPIPFLELRPEFRHFDSDFYTLDQFSMQVHVFY